MVPILARQKLSSTCTDGANEIGRIEQQRFDLGKREAVSYQPELPALTERRNLDVLIGDVNILGELHAKGIDVRWSHLPARVVSRECCGQRYMAYRHVWRCGRLSHRHWS